MVRKAQYEEAAGCIVTRLGVQDKTRLVKGINRSWDSEYDADCAACWLGHAHSIAVHEMNMRTSGG